MNKRVFALILLLAAALALSGCRFAMEETEAQNSRGRMVGMSLRVYDPGEPDGVDEEGNVYWLPTEEESMPQELTEEEFKALLGGGPRSDAPAKNEYPIGEYYYYAWKRTDDLGVTNGAEDHWPGSVQTHITVNDEGEKLELDAAVYLNSEAFGDFVSFHIDPIYERADGSVYCARDLAGVSGHIDGFSQTVTEETKTTGIDGEVESYAMEFTVRYEHKKQLREARVLAFDAQHNVLSESVLVPEETEHGDLRCDYAPPEGAAYLLLEEHFADGAVARTSADLASASPTLALFTVYVSDGGYFAYPCRVFLEE
ncbi:MAG: hypothetical protein Q4A66_01305 [Eubacteriales bacterium]|nr:hypothetical protein [Eubacteriales bacterium]